MKHYTYQKGITQPKTLLDAIGVSTTPLTETSNSQQIAGAKSVMIELIGTGITTRSAVLTITAAVDGGTNFRAYNMLIDNLANANTEMLTRVASKTLAATGHNILWMTPETLGAITHIKATLIITDTGTPAGTFSVIVTVNY